MTKKILVLTAVIMCALCVFSCGDQTDKGSEVESTTAAADPETTAKTVPDNTASSAETNEPEALSLRTDGRAFNISVFTDNSTESFRWIQYSDRTQFSISTDEEMILIISDGRFLSVGNALVYDNQVYLPYTVLEALGIEQEETNEGFGTMSFSSGDIKLRIPWASDFYTIEKDNDTVSDKRYSIYHNDILYIPAEILEYFSYSINYPEALPNHDDCTAIIISKEDRVPAFDKEWAGTALKSEIEKIYAEEIKRCEAELAEGRAIYPDEAFERMKSDSENIPVEYVETYSDYYVFKLSDTRLYIYINMYNGEVYYDSFNSLPELRLTNGIMDVSSLYY